MYEYTWRGVSSYSNIIVIVMGTSRGVTILMTVFARYVKRAVMKYGDDIQVGGRGKGLEYVRVESIGGGGGGGCETDELFCPDRQQD